MGEHGGPAEIPVYLSTAPDEPLTMSDGRPLSLPESDATPANPWWLRFGDWAMHLLLTHLGRGPGAHRGILAPWEL